MPTAADDRAVFVMEGASGLTAAVELLRRSDHISVEHLVGSEADRRTLIGHAEKIARTLQVDQVHWSGYPAGRKRISPHRFEALANLLGAEGVPLWRDGTASLSQTLYARGMWAALALIVGLGSISLAVFSGMKVTWLHIALPAALCAIGVAFAIWQIGLLALAARRAAGWLAFGATAAAAVAAFVAIGTLLADRAVPSVAEMWAIYTGDVALNDLAVTIDRDGRTLHVAGSYGVGSAEAVRRALDANPGIRTVVLSGPGGRASVGFELYRLFQQRRLATRVDGACASACTIAFLGGVDRSVSPGGRLGFHRASFPGMSDDDMHESNRDLRRFMIYGAKVTPEFVDRVFDTAPDSIWVPTPQELVAGRVVTRVVR
ncbi:hypothetical protein [Reyranella sp.]|uniref:hypothetical protein n=1 Tax=Reyranella sp. TaxID=1929291 RepID=UPI003783EB23